MSLPSSSPAEPKARTLLFLYGTLKRGGANHQFVMGQTYIAEARTIPGFRLYALDGYPGMVPDPADREGVTGEIWSVDSLCLATLDKFEGVDEGLYTRSVVPLAVPHQNDTAYAYIFAGSVANRTVIGPTWPVSPE